MSLKDQKTIGIWIKEFFEFVPRGLSLSGRNIFSIMQRILKDSNPVDQTAKVRFF